MMDISARNIEGVWFGVACQGEEIFATNFASDEKSVLDGLLRAIPFEVPVQKLETPTPFAERAIVTLKDVYD